MPIGEGSFSKVWLVKNNLNNKLYAAKLINKKGIIERGLTYNVKIERNILKHNNHPNLMKLKYAF